MDTAKFALILFLALALTLSTTLFTACKKEEAEEEEAVEEGVAEEEVLEPEEEAEPTKFTQDETKTVGEHKVTVKTWELLAGDDKLKPSKEGNVLVLIDVEVAHAQGGVFMVASSMSFRLKGKGTKEFEPIKYKKKDAFTDGMIEPGKTAKGIVAFEVPKDIEGLVFTAGKFKYDDPSKVKFELSKETPYEEPPA